MKSGSRIPNNPSNPPLEECIRAIRLVAFDFDGVFTDNLVYVFEDGSEAVRARGGYGAVREVCDLFEWLLTSGQECAET